MKHTVLIGCAAVLVGFSAWFLRHKKNTLFDDIDIDFDEEDYDGWSDER